jgi:phosphoenolpyruvate carboxykinase (GTP)
MRPFMSYPEGDYAAHWREVIGKTTQQPIFAHVNWFQRDAAGGYLWPGYRENLRALLWLVQFKNGEVSGRQTPVGVVPVKEELNLDGLQIDDDALNTLLSIDVSRWKQEIGFRKAHLDQFTNLPEAIWEAHRRVAAALDEASAAG